MATTILNGSAAVLRWAKSRSHGLLVASLLLLLPMSKVCGEGDAPTTTGRRGLVTSAAVGPGITSFDQTHYLACGTKWQAPTHTKLSLHTKGKLGYAPTDYFASYFVTESYWFSMSFVATGRREIARTGMFGLGMTFYSSSTWPSAYVSIEVGRSFFGAPFETKVGSQLGTGISAGLGYQFSRKYSVELCATQTRTANTGLVTKSWSYSISLTSQ